jgi:hypothetical protein
MLNETLIIKTLYLKSAEVVKFTQNFEIATQI